MTFNNSQRKWVFMVFFIFLLFLAGWMLRRFLEALIVGGLIAYFIYPLYKKILIKVKSKRLAQVILSAVSVIFLLMVILIVIFPLISQTQFFYTRSEQYVNTFLSNIDSCSIEDNSLECGLAMRVKSFLQTDNFTQKSKEFIKKASGLLFTKITKLASSIASFILFLVIMVFSIFFFLDRGENIKKGLMEMLPLRDSHKEKIFGRLEQTVKAVVGGNITTALLQGVAGGIIFIILGIPAPLFWGLIMAILAFIPVVGPTLIWLPAVILFFLKGSILKGIILLVYSALVFGFIENILKPKLIGNRIKLPAFIIFLGVIGGLQMFGILGLFFGPIILALITTCAQIYQEMSV